MPASAITSTSASTAHNRAPKAEIQERHERFHARLSARQKQILEEAAAIEGRTLSDFVLTHAQEAALKTIREHLLLSLSESDSLTFINALLSPWKPSAALRDEIAQMRDLFDGE